MSIYLLNR